MGLMSKIGASVKNADSKLGQGVDEAKLKSKISDEKVKITKIYNEIGELYYKSLKDTSINFAEQSKSLIEKIDESNKVIETTEKELADIKEKGEKERLENKAAAE